MKTFKILDVWISMILIIGFMVASILLQDFTFMVGYFVVGGWQVISMIVHAFNGWFCEKGSARVIYHWIVGIVIGSALLGLAVPPILYLLMVVMLFAAPVMAIWYAWLCYREVYVKMQRPLAMLK